MISCSVKNLQLPRGKFFLVSPAKETRSILSTSYLKFSKIARTTFTFDVFNFKPTSVFGWSSNITDFFNKQNGVHQALPLLKFFPNPHISNSYRAKPDKIFDDFWFGKLNFRIMSVSFVNNNKPVVFLSIRPTAAILAFVAPRTNSSTIAVFLSFV